MVKNMGGATHVHYAQLSVTISSSNTERKHRLAAQQKEVAITRLELEASLRAVLCVALVGCTCTVSLDAVTCRMDTW